MSLPVHEAGPSDARASVIWLHGLGADGTDFLPALPMLGLDDVRFVLPDAPVRPVTLNGGWAMPSWYDIRALSPGPERESVADLREAAGWIEALITREEARGVPRSRIALVGFSQGGALALYVGLRQPAPLAGVVGLSTYLAAPQLLAAERIAGPTPYWLAHGTADSVVDVVRGREAFAAISAGSPASWQEYPMDHEVCVPELTALGAWLGAALTR